MNKVIHYCWFGGNPLPKNSIRCIKSWKEYCPEYEIKLWNEDNFDFESIPFTADAYKAKKWAFVSDYVRTYALFKEGGLYLDTDVELIRPINDLLETSFIGFENLEYVNPGLILYAAEKEQNVFGRILSIYNNLKFDISSMCEKTSPVIYTKTLEDMGLKRDGTFQIVEGISIYPIEYFNPLGSDWRKSNYFTNNTRSIHHFEASWLEKTEKEYLYLRRRHGELWGKVFFCVKHPIKGVKKWLSRRL